MAITPLICSLSDSALLLEADRLAANERTSTAALIATLREIDARRLYLAEGYSCMFFYCTKRLHLSEQAAYSRIEVARVSRTIPAVLDALETGALNLTTALTIAPHLTADNQADLIDAASFKSKREAERLVAERFGEHDHPRGYKIQFTADQDTYDKLRQAQALLRHQNPYGDLAPIVNKALTLLIADIERRRLGLVGRPRAVAKVTAEGSRQHGFLEFHHVKPFAEGGPSTVENIEMRCRVHNVHEARLAGLPFRPG